MVFELTRGNIDNSSEMKQSMSYDTKILFYAEAYNWTSEQGVAVPVRSYSSLEHIDGCKEDLCSLNGCIAVANGSCLDNQGSVGVSREYVAARKIQTAYRAHAVCYPCS
ncbi:hypothetical protein SASPL_121442 [Salvia splendens]|uniref:Uncharacterized protein n=1 Tax=Salvia splendens TaxID=180675 RepID=A0A8X8XUB7_SALSN|nr:hypothetical protein SASPL_121440 [Salvia splendens]KAG6419226.1 hypothetical protein SASPL_121442 [Salvia splendens]